MILQEKLDNFKKDILYSKYCDMTIDELKDLRESIFENNPYNIPGYEKTIERIDTIIELKGLLNGTLASN